jgi:hypothetical protein
MANLIANKEDIFPATVNKNQLVAEELNQLFTEINHIIEDAGLTPSSSDLAQIKKAIIAMITTAIAGKQDAISAGDGISISGTEVSVDNTIARVSALSDYFKLEGGSLNNGASITLKSADGTKLGTISVTNAGKVTIVDSTGSKIELGTGLDITTSGNTMPKVNGSELAKASDLGGYLPLSGGTLTGDLTLSNSSSINTKFLISRDGGYIQLFNSDNTQDGCFGYYNNRFRHIGSGSILESVDKAVANGVASLDSNTKVPLAQLPVDTSLNKTSDNPISNKAVASNYVKGVTSSNATVTVTKGDDSTSSFTIDNVANATTATKDSSGNTISSYYAPKATTISGYGITDAYTKTEIDGKISGAFHYKGTKTTYSQLPTSGNQTGDVWNIETADPTHGVKAGDNVVWNSTDWDVLSGIVDLSSYAQKSEAVGSVTGSNATVTVKDVNGTQLGTFTIDNVANATEAAQVNTSASSANSALKVFFADSSSDKKLAYDSDLTYNPSTNTFKATNFDGLATKATADASGNTITTTYATKTELSSEAQTRLDNDNTLTTNLGAEVTARQNADTLLDGRVTTIEGKIPTNASSTNKLADKDYVDQSIQTATANFRGNFDTYALVPTDVNQYKPDESGSKTPTTNDYIIIRTDETQDGGTWRYKYIGSWSTDGKNGWSAEYEINENPLTPSQLAALNSGITNTLVGQITTNQNNISSLTLNKQDTVIGAASTVTSSNLSANKAVISNNNGKLDVSAVTSTELGHLSGVTSSVQNQLNAKLDITTAASTYLPLTGGTLTGNLELLARNNSNLAFGINTDGYSAMISLTGEADDQNHKSTVLRGAKDDFRIYNSVDEANYGIQLDHTTNTLYKLAGLNTRYRFLDESDKAVANGVASLDSNTKVPVAQIPDLSDQYYACTFVDWSE